MSGERNSQINKHARLEYLGASIIAGGLVGTLIGYPASLLSGNGPELGVGIGTVLAGGLFAVSQGPISIEEALENEKKIGYGNPGLT